MKVYQVVSYVGDSKSNLGLYETEAFAQKILSALKAGGAVPGELKVESVEVVSAADVKPIIRRAPRKVLGKTIVPPSNGVEARDALLG